MVEIEVSTDFLEELNKLKSNKNETYEEVIWNLIRKSNELSHKNKDSF